MAHRRTGALAGLRGRAWRLAALVLWASIVLVNLGAVMGVQAAQPAIEVDLHASLCHADGNPGAGDQGTAHTAPHCPLCLVVAAGILAPPTAAQVLVLAPSTDWIGQVWSQRSALFPPLSRATASPRAPPAFV